MIKKGKLWQNTELGKGEKKSLEVKLASTKGVVA